MSDVYDYDWENSPDPYEFEGDLAYEQNNDNSEYGDDITFDLDSWVDDWDTGWNGDIGWDWSLDMPEQEKEYTPQTVTDDYAPDFTFEELDLESLDKYADGQDKDEKGLLQNLLNSKAGVSLLGGLLQGGFQAWQQAQSDKRAGELSDKDFERQKELLRLKAELSRGGGGGGSPKAETIADKPQGFANGQKSVKGDFTKRV